MRAAGDRPKYRERAVDKAADVQRLREPGERLLGDDEAEQRDVHRTARSCRLPGIPSKRTIEQRESDGQPYDSGDDCQMSELARDVAGAGEREARKHRAGGVGAEAPREPVGAVSRDEQQHDHEQIEGRRGCEQRERRQAERIGRRSGERDARAELARPDRPLPLANHLSDQDTPWQLTVENVRREVVVGHVDHAEREQTPVREQHTEGQEGPRRQAAANAVSHPGHVTEYTSTRLPPCCPLHARRRVYHRRRASRSSGHRRRAAH